MKFESSSVKRKAATSVLTRKDDDEITAVHTALSANQSNKQNRNEAVLLMCREVAVWNNEAKRKCRTTAIFDVGNQLSYISKRLANELAIEGKRRKMAVSSFGSKTQKSGFGNGFSRRQTEVRKYSANASQHNRLFDYAATSGKCTGNSEPEKVKQVEGFLATTGNFDRFMKSTPHKQLPSGFQLILTKVGGIIAGTRQTQSDRFVRPVLSACYVTNVKKEHQMNSHDGLCFGKLKSVAQRLQNKPELLQKYDADVFSEASTNIKQFLSNNEQFNASILEKFMEYAGNENEAKDGIFGMEDCEITETIRCHQAQKALHSKEGYEERLPVIDSNGSVRCSGRLGELNHSVVAEPLTVPGRNRFTELLIHPFSKKPKYDNDANSGAMDSPGTIDDESAMNGINRNSANEGNNSGAMVGHETVGKSGRSRHDGNASTFVRQVSMSRRIEKKKRIRRSEW